MKLDIGRPVTIIVAAATIIVSHRVVSTGEISRMGGMQPHAAKADGRYQILLRPYGSNVMSIP
jgi:hypothetical protein